MEREIEDTFTYDVAIPVSRRLQEDHDGDTKWVLRFDKSLHFNLKA